MKAGLFKNILTMIYIKKYCGNRIFKIKKGPVAPGDAEREGVGQFLNLLHVEARVVPVGSKPFLLAFVEPSDFLRKVSESTTKVSRLDYLHATAGG